METIPAGYEIGKLQIPVEIPTREFMCFMANGKPNYIRPRDIKCALSMDSGALCIVFGDGNILIESQDEIDVALKNLGYL